jgi:hypothetical protein
MTRLPPLFTRLRISFNCIYRVTAVALAEEAVAVSAVVGAPVEQAKSDRLKIGGPTGSVVVKSLCQVPSLARSRVGATESRHWSRRFVLALCCATSGGEFCPWNTPSMDFIRLH